MASAADSELRHRLLPESEHDDGSEQGTSLADLPYSGKVFMARKKKPDPTYVRVLEVSQISSYTYRCTKY